MFESITRAVSAHKQVVIAAIAVSGLVMYAVGPTLPNAYAQFLNGIGINLGGISVSLDDRVRVDVGEYGQVSARVGGIEVDTNDEVRVVVPGLNEIRVSLPFGFGFL